MDLSVTGGSRLQKSRDIKLAAIFNGIKIIEGGFTFYEDRRRI
jgi:hypothetical protein